jgi:hypothetical protein|tara:strand:+ start:53 stop:571 length:519 start_codon:yes stop_codon:yes gene_type:complete
MTFKQGGIPFTPNNLHALRTGGIRNPQQREGLLPCVVEVPADVASRCRSYDAETTYDRCMRWGHVAGLVIAVGFVAVVTIMLCVMSIRMSDALNTLDGDTLSAKLDKLLDYGLASARNAHLATSNVVAMTEEARVTVAMAGPRLQHAVNDTGQLVDDLRSWSFHPSLAIAPG